MWQDYQITFPHTRPCYAKSSYRSVDPQTLHGNVNKVDHVPNGPTNSAAITTISALRLCGGKPLVAVTRERRYGPSRLRVNDVVRASVRRMQSVLACVRPREDGGGIRRPSVIQFLCLFGLELENDEKTTRAVTQLTVT